MAEDVGPVSVRMAESIAQRFEAGEFYDALQLVKTVYSRVTARGKWKDAVQLCMEYSLKFADYRQYGLAIELGLSLVNAFENGKLTTTEDFITSVIAIFESCPTVSTLEKFKLISRALRLSRKTSSNPYGDITLHRAAAIAYWEIQDFGRCQGHLVYCQEGELLANMVLEWQNIGYPSERDLFPLRTVLILLSLQDIPTALVFLTKFNVPSKNQPPALQFAYLLIAACSERNGKFYDLLRTKYNLIIRRDPSFEKFLAEIEKKCFGRAPKGGGRLMNLFSSLLGVGDDGGDD